MMCIRRHTPYTDQRRAFVVHDQFIHGAFKAIDTFLNSRDYILSALQTFLALYLRQIYPQTYKHDSQETRLMAIRLPVLFDVRDNGSWDVETEVFFDSTDVISAKGIK